MIKKFLLLSLVASQLMVSCSSDESNDETTKPETELSLEEQIAAIVKQPYSKLTPGEQKLKLEAEANQMLTELDKTKSSGAIEALENLSRLLGVDQIELFDGKDDNGIEDILTVSGVYGVYTWNNTNEKWVKTTSTTELKFVFPAKESQTANNAVFTSKSVSSDIKVKFATNYYDDEEITDYFFLPLSADAVLTIDNAQAATFTQTAKYANGKEIPTDFAYKMTLNDGYTWEMSGVKAAQNTSKASLTYNGKTLINFNAGSNAEIDKLLANEELTQYRGKANGLFQLMDNFIIVADMDLVSEAADQAALEKSVVHPDYPDYQNPKTDFKAYYTAKNVYEKKYSEGSAVNFNKNIKLVLVSKKDGTKIADIIQHSAEDYSYYANIPVWTVDQWNPDGYWSYNEEFKVQYYGEDYYLKFNDNTEVSMSTYFSEGFDTFQTKFEDFISAFNKEEK